MHRPGAVGRLAGVLGSTVLLAACGRALPGAGSQAPGSSPSVSSPGISAIAGPPAPSTLPNDVQRLEGPGWDAAGLAGSVPGPGACRAGRAGNGAPLPDPRCTPGAVDVTVTQANLASTICRTGGYSDAVRPPEALTEPFKYLVLAAYGDTGPPGDYELDHLVPLGLGGASSTANLWPEPDDHPRPGFANSKDVVELELHDMVCAPSSGGRHLLLVAAQALIAQDWTTAVDLARRDLSGSG